MKQIYSHLSVTCIDKEHHRQTCGYWYLVSSHHTAHTAFWTKWGLLNFLNERNLTLVDVTPEDLPMEKTGIYMTSRIGGSYIRNCTMDEGEFAKAIADPTAIISSEMDNGDCTLAALTKDADGVVTVTLLNPNLPRVKLPYAITGVSELSECFR